MSDKWYDQLPESSQHWVDVKPSKYKQGKPPVVKGQDQKVEEKKLLPLIDFYPFPSTRPGTEEALDRIKKAFDDGKRFVLIDAPTGSGKSGIAVACARKYNSVILTPTKLLQEQYASTKEFGREYTIKGKANYCCGLPGLTHVPVSESVCASDTVTEHSRQLLPEFIDLPKGKNKISSILKSKCAEKGVCPYYTKIHSIGKVPGAVLNYDLFFLLKRYPGQKFGVDMGDTLILDEAHQLTDKVRDIFGFAFSTKSFKRLFGDSSGDRKKIDNKLEEPVKWLERVLGVAQGRLVLEKDGKKVAKFDSFVKKASYILAQELSDEKKFYIEDKRDEVEIKPLDLRFLKGKIFFPFNRVVMLSATFPGNFKEIFALKDEECEVITIPSTFSKEKRPIFFAKDAPKLNKSSVLTKYSQNISLLDSILDAHKDHKGIIHTGNYKFMDQLRKIYGRNKRFIWVGQDKDKDEMLEKHSKSQDPTILVSPSMMEGLDLKDDLARFGVILKVPYPMLDEYTRRMMKIYPSWYDSLTATNVCQAYGRQVRTAEDWSYFYIVDGTFWFCLNSAKECYSKYFLEALKVGSQQNLVSLLKEEDFSE